MSPAVSLSLLMLLSPLAPQGLGDERYFERFRVGALCDDGSFVLLEMTIHNVGPGDGYGFCQLLVVNPENTAAHRTQPSDSYAHTTTPYPRLTVGPCVLRGGAALEATATFERLRATITLAAEPRELHLPGDRVRLGTKKPVPGQALDAGPPFYEATTLVPWSAARISVTARTQSGEHPAVRQGHGFAERIRSTVLPNDIASHWISVRTAGPTPLVMHLRLAPDGSRASGWLWQPGLGEPVAVSDVVTLKIQRQNDDTSDLSPFAADVHSPAGNFRLLLHKEIFRRALGSDLGLAGYALEALFGNPVNHIFRGEVSSAAGHFRGIIEVLSENETAVLGPLF